ncbi:MAG: transglutaminase domain-containing protein [Deltaproteobacteria bacterium]|nr:transglutaminase domain-containing protein [Deltaproteobacteria bacterium]
MTTDQYLMPTNTIEATHPLVTATAKELTQGLNTDIEKATRLFYFVRDEIRYNIYMISMFEEDFRASFIMEAKKGYCVQKAVLLCALGRAAGIPTRLAFAKILNKRVPEKLYKRVKTNIFPAHGYNQLLLEGRWISAAATFDKELCEMTGVPTVEFDGRNDVLLPNLALDGGPYIEYIKRFGPETDLPLNWIVGRTSEIWGDDKRAWLRPKDENNVLDRGIGRAE